MSLGVIRNANSLPVATPTYGVIINPNFVFTSTPAGSATSVICEAIVSGGAGGFTYLWEFVSGDAITIDSPAEKETTFGTSGSSGESKLSVVKVTSFDTGNGNAEVFSEITVTFAFIDIGEE